MMLVARSAKELERLSRENSALFASGKICVWSAFTVASLDCRSECACGRICVWSVLTVSSLDFRSACACGKICVSSVLTALSLDCSSGSKRRLARSVFATMELSLLVFSASALVTCCRLSADCFSEAMVFVCRPDHSLSHRSSVAVPDLREETILRPPPGWGTRAIIDAAFGATQSAFEIANYSLMARLVREGFATTLAPESAISGEMLNGLCAIPVDDARLRWTLSTAVCTDRRMTAATTVLLRALIQAARDRPAELVAVAIP